MQIEIDPVQWTFVQSHGQQGAIQRGNALECLILYRTSRVGESPGERNDRGAFRLRYSDCSRRGHGGVTQRAEHRLAMTKRWESRRFDEVPIRRRPRSKGMA